MKREEVGRREEGEGRERREREREGRDELAIEECSS